MALLTIAFAQSLWTNGYCVEVQVPDLGTGTKSVQPNSETPFTAKVQHKWEGTQLTVPVIATLTDGQVSVNPSGSKVPAPATFTYQAPDKSGQKATVHLETRSKRGIAKLDVNFTTGGGWKGAIDFPDPGDVTTGIVCDLTKPFTLHYKTWQINFEFQFTPSDQNRGGGSVSFSGLLNWNVFVDQESDWQPFSDHNVYSIGQDPNSPESPMEINIYGGDSIWTHPDGGAWHTSWPLRLGLVPLDTNECGQP
jgi:hypothetical protein